MALAGHLSDWFSLKAVFQAQFVQPDIEISFYERRDGTIRVCGELVPAGSAIATDLWSDELVIPVRLAFRNLSRTPLVLHSVECAYRGPVQVRSDGDPVIDIDGCSTIYKHSMPVIPSDAAYYPLPAVDELRIPVARHFIHALGVDDEGFLVHHLRCAQGLGFDGKFGPYQKDPLEYETSIAVAVTPVEFKEVQFLFRVPMAISRGLVLSPSGVQPSRTVGPTADDYAVFEGARTTTAVRPSWEAKWAATGQLMSYAVLQVAEKTCRVVCIDGRVRQLHTDENGDGRVDAVVTDNTGDGRPDLRREYRDGVVMYDWNYSCALNRYRRDGAVTEFLMPVRLVDTRGRVIAPLNYQSLHGDPDVVAFQLYAESDDAAGVRSSSASLVQFFDPPINRR